MLRKFLKLYIFIFLVAIYLVINIDCAQCQNNKIQTDKISSTEIASEVVNGTTFISITCFYESLGWNVSWNSEENKITAEKVSQKAEFKVDSSTVMIDNSYKVELEMPIIIKNKRAFVCSSFIIREYGLKVVWDNVNNTLIVPDKQIHSIEISGKGNVIIVSDGLIINIYKSYYKDTAQDMISYADNLLEMGKPEEAIWKYKEILDNISEAQNPQIYAYVFNNMGNAYSTIAEVKDVKSNLGKAIELYYKALYMNRNNNSVGIQSIYNNLGLAYRNLYEVSRDKKYLITAVNMFCNATKEEWHENNILGYASAEYYKGRSYIDLGHPELARAELIKALKVYNDQMKIYTTDTSPYERSDLMIKLGNLYTDMSTIDNTENDLMMAKCFFEEALKVRKLECYPMDYANIHESLGNVYKYLSGLCSKRDYLLKADEEYKESLKIYSGDNSSIKYALVSYKIGILHMELGEIEDKKGNQMKAKIAFEDAFRVFNELEYKELNKLIDKYIADIKY